jgi:hypothetical protein
MEVTKQILEIRKRFIEILSFPIRALANWILSVGNVFDNINKTLSGIPEKILNYFDSLIDWINTKAIEFFTSIVQPIILIFLDMIVKLFKDVGIGLLKIPGSFASSLIDKYTPQWAKNLFITEADWNKFTKTISDGANTIFKPISNLINDIPDLV